MKIKKILGFLAVGILLLAVFLFTNKHKNTGKDSGATFNVQSTDEEKPGDRLSGEGGGTADIAGDTGGIDHGSMDEKPNDESNDSVVKLEGPEDNKVAGSGGTEMDHSSGEKPGGTDMNHGTGDPTGGGSCSDQDLEVIYDAFAEAGMFLEAICREMNASATVQTIKNLIPGYTAEQELLLSSAISACTSNICEGYQDIQGGSMGYGECMAEISCDTYMVHLAHSLPNDTYYEVIIGNDITGQVVGSGIMDQSRLAPNMDTNTWTIAPACGQEVTVWVHIDHPALGTVSKVNLTSHTMPCDCAQEEESDPVCGDDDFDATTDNIVSTTCNTPEEVCIPEAGESCTYCNANCVEITITDDTQYCLDGAAIGTPGTSCDDGSATTENDVLQSDGCTCVGIVIEEEEPDLECEPIACTAVVCEPDESLEQTESATYDANGCQETCDTYECIAPGPVCGEAGFDAAEDGDDATTCNTPGTICVPVAGSSCSYCNINCEETVVTDDTQYCPDGELMGTPGASCDDENATTQNDMIQADGCTCIGDDVSYDISINKEITSSGPYSPGETISYILTIKNNGLFYHVPYLQVIDTVLTNMGEHLTISNIVISGDAVTSGGGNASAGGSGGSLINWTNNWIFSNFKSGGEIVIEYDIIVGAEFEGSLKNTAKVKLSDIPEIQEDIPYKNGSCETGHNPHTGDYAVVGTNNIDCEEVMITDDTELCSDGTLMGTPGTSCDDGNATTQNDMIQTDGCICAGVLIQQEEPETPEEYSWQVGGYGECSTTVCGSTGIQTKAVSCIDSTGNNVQDSMCTGEAPVLTQDCVNDPCEAYEWNTESRSTCDATCGGGEQSRAISCLRVSDKLQVSDSFCEEFSTKPDEIAPCNTDACAEANWKASSWDACTKVCGGGEQTRKVECVNSGGFVVASSECTGVKPETYATCNSQDCDTYNWKTETWSICSASCDGGIQTRDVECISSNNSIVTEEHCELAKPSISRICNTSACESHTASPHRGSGGNGSRAITFCGDGEVNQESEECDDGNYEDTDGCSRYCRVEAGFAPEIPKEEVKEVEVPEVEIVEPVEIVEIAECGDGKVNQDIEECDDGNVKSNDGCSDACKVEDTKVCGDGVKNQLQEECDDGNMRNGDGCSSACILEVDDSIIDSILKKQKLFTPQYEEHAGLDPAFTPPSFLPNTGVFASPIFGLMSLLEKLIEIVQKLF